PKAAEMAAVTKDAAIRPIAQAALSPSGRSSSKLGSRRQRRQAVGTGHCASVPSRAGRPLLDQASPISWVTLPVPPQLPHACPPSTWPDPAHFGHTASPLSGEPGGTSSPGFIPPCPTRLRSPDPAGGADAMMILLVAAAQPASGIPDSIRRCLGDRRIPTGISRVGGFVIG